MIDEILKLFSFLNTVSPLALLALAIFVIYKLVISKNNFLAVPADIEKIKSNHLEHIQQTLIEISTQLEFLNKINSEGFARNEQSHAEQTRVLSALSESIAVVNTKLNGTSTRRR